MLASLTNTLYGSSKQLRHLMNGTLTKTTVWKMKMRSDMLKKTKYPFKCVKWTTPLWNYPKGTNSLHTLMMALPIPLTSHVFPCSTWTRDMSNMSQPGGYHHAKLVTDDLALLVFTFWTRAHTHIRVHTNCHYPFIQMALPWNLHSFLFLCHSGVAAVFNNPLITH